MTVAIEGLAGARALRTLVLGRMEKLAGRVQNGPLAVRVAFTDENGPKGGRDTRCAITLDLPRRPPFHAEAVAENARLAFDTALDALERRISRERGRARDDRRRPKKYFVAKRLLIVERGERVAESGG